MTATGTAPIIDLILHWNEQYRVGIPRFDEQHFLEESGEEPTLGIRVLQMMQTWLKRHLLECDLRYSEYFEKRAMQVEITVKN